MNITPGKKKGIEYNFDKLNHFAMSLGKKYIVKVGILANSQNWRSAAESKSEGGKTNAEVGFANEMGSASGNLPKRSFLRAPLHLKTDEILNSAKNDMLKHLTKGDARKIYANMGAACVGIIGEAFDTSGFGTWPALKPETIKQKIGENPSPLINTQQLRRSIIFQIEERK